MVIIGGGLAGLTAAILLRRRGFDVTLIEKKSYPFHRVCGEYISNEVAGFLIANDMDFRSLQPAKINTLHFSAPSGADLKLPLDLGGFGLSRFAFDHFLYQMAVQSGVEVLTDEVTDVRFNRQDFSVSVKSGKQLEANLVIGSFGKRSSVDVKMNRSFLQGNSGFIGVKMHYDAEYPESLIGLHNFRGGYAGISNVEGKRVNLCYMTRAEVFKETGDFKGFEEHILRKNPHLRDFLNDARPLFERPLVISQMYFGLKAPVENHMMMAGDAAGAITPLTGNGMAMAIRSAHLIDVSATPFLEGKISRDQMESNYRTLWNRHFRKRIATGNTLQPLFGKERLSNLSMKVIQSFPGLMPKLIAKTHGPVMTQPS